MVLLPEPGLGDKRTFSHALEPSDDGRGRAVSIRVGCVPAPSPTCQEISFSFPGHLPMERVLKTAANTLPLLVSRASPGPAAPGGERRAERAPCLPLAPGSPPATRVPRPPAEASKETHLSREVFPPTRGWAPCPSPATLPPHLL